jgi:hypothetical protein
MEEPAFEAINVVEVYSTLLGTWTGIDSRYLMPKFLRGDLELREKRCKRARQHESRGRTQED